MSRRIAAEALGSLLLTATVIGSGIMAERLSQGSAALALLANTAATVAVLAALIALLAPLSGAHFNPLVSAVECLRGRLSRREALAYCAVQTLGCCALDGRGVDWGSLLVHGIHVVRKSRNYPGAVVERQLRRYSAKGRSGLHCCADGGRSERMDPGALALA